MSLLARAPRQIALRTRLNAPVRFAHGHGEYKHLPFEHKAKNVFATKLASYLLVGFSIPFIASWWQLKKTAGAA